MPVLGAPLHSTGSRGRLLTRVHTGVRCPGDVIVGSVVGATIGEATALATRVVLRR